jgi:hypothetical protein
MDIVKARIIKSWRESLGCSWRRVAELYDDVWPGEINRGHQIDGAELCHEAMTLLNEDWHGGC